MTNNAKQQKTALIIGAGPAGLTAAFELLKKTNIKPIVLEQSDFIGGISRTVNYKGNRMDIGGHRFFSKSERVMDWWLDMMPMQLSESGETMITYHRATTSVKTSEKAPDPEQTDLVMLVRNRKSRIYFMRKFFEYPVSLSLSTLTNLGIVRTVKVGISYLQSMLFPVKPENTLAEFFTNRFGRELYLTFFKSYTEKVWGVPCNEISAAWGAQRIKGLDLRKALIHFASHLLPASKDIEQKNTETSLIERFLYPKLGPGQMWEYVAEQIQEKGAQVRLNSRVDKLAVDGNNVTSVSVFNEKTGETEVITADYVFSTMPMKELVRKLDVAVPANVKEVSEGLLYRDFITVGLLLKELTIKDERAESAARLIADNWIYIQEPDVKLGRLQIFNNWSPYLVADKTKVWLGLEYFCDDTDEMWKLDDASMIKFAGEELEKIGIIEVKNIEDATVIHVPKTYPGYFGTYDRFDELVSWINRFENLFLVGRNGMHKYNNQDHSMLTAMVAVENIANGVKSKDNLWSINTETDYHEEKTAAAASAS
ncbi:MAG: NAD(P)/FAD-dependent oxidoreductase [Candidatus Obscuribacterales bacterium]|nr:NAD(P)/FAD-dependent oxidoreductase [Candidatus Obscuribacterales bacterium]